MKETGFLTRPEQDLVAMLNNYADHLQMMKKAGLPIALTKRQYSTFERLCAKAKEHPEYDYAKHIPDGKFRGHPVSCLEERTRYRKNRLESLPL